MSLRMLKACCLLMSLVANFRAVLRVSRVNKVVRTDLCCAGSDMNRRIHGQQKRREVHDFMAASHTSSAEQGEKVTTQGKCCLTWHAV